MDTFIHFYQSHLSSFALSQDNQFTLTHRRVAIIEEDHSLSNRCPHINSVSAAKAKSYKMTLKWLSSRRVSTDTEGDRREGDRRERDRKKRGQFGFQHAVRLSLNSHCLECHCFEAGGAIAAHMPRCSNTMPCVTTRQDCVHVNEPRRHS